MGRKLNFVNISYIRKGQYTPAPTTPIPVSRSGEIPLILKLGGLKSSGQRLISSNSKTKIIEYLKIFVAIFFCC